jgi:membrane-associated phospholipid phosphatase
MFITLVRFITDFGDQAVLLPMAIGIGLILTCSHWRRAAVGWTIGIGGTYLTMLVLKLCFIACGYLLPGHIISPSGHVAAATAVYGGMVALASRVVSGHGRWLLPCAIGIAIIIGTTRVTIGAHNVPEVVIGAVIGICGALSAVAMIGQPPHKLRIGWSAGLVCAILLLCHGFRMPVEAAIHDVSSKIWPLSQCHAQNLRHSEIVL